MNLSGYFFKSDGQRKLLSLLFAEGLEASAFELSRLAGLGYSSTYYELEELKKNGVLQERKDGKAEIGRASCRERV